MPGDATSPFIHSFIIFLREGAEAALILAALWVVLSSLQAPRRAHHALLGGAAAGVAASVAGGVALFGLAGTLQEQTAELVEGLTMLLAAAVLLFVSSWLLGQREARHWQEKLRRDARCAFATGGLWALFAVGFLAVFREGVETVLFLGAAMAGEGAHVAAVVLGAGTAAAVLLAAFLAVRMWGVRLPLKAFFTVTAWALLALAVIYAGKGVHELQEAGVLAETALPGWPRLAVLGIYPHAEPLAAQALTLLAGLALNMRVLHTARTAGSTARQA